MTGSGFYTSEEAKERFAELRMEKTDLKDSLAKLLSEQKVNDILVKEVSTDFIREQLKEFLELKDRLNVIKFRQLLAASIKRIDISNKKLKDIQFYFIAHIPESRSPSDSYFLGYGYKQLPSYFGDYILKKTTTYLWYGSPRLIRNALYTCSNRMNRIT
ncbi:hypothetical protein [Virgibacillus proomii]|uniref:hypothetical protein n=1 Tax=Virgibacillus proomii TaxID=84407 RepID=UPI0011806B6F|nr:hypothetical protein [Virgibacillus proomii]